MKKFILPRMVLTENGAIHFFNQGEQVWFTIGLLGGLIESISDKIEIGKSIEIIFKRENGPNGSTEPMTMALWTSPVRRIIW